MRFYNPDDTVIVTQRRLPHWSQAGSICFITWRTDDSMPKAVVESWLISRNDWLRRHGIDPSVDDWKTSLSLLEESTQAEYHATLTTRWHDELDACHGACVLRKPELAAIVRDSLMHFESVRYQMHDFVIMPNHVHLLAVFPDQETMLKQCMSWKHFSAGRINERLSREGRFWQQDAFDHLVRHEAQFERLKRYIAENPARAGLRPGEFVHYSRPHAPREVMDGDSSRGA